METNPKIDAIRAALATGKPLTQLATELGCSAGSLHVLSRRHGLSGGSHNKDGRDTKAWATRDLAGRRFGLLFVVSQSRARIQQRVTWNCVCDCGTVALVSSKLLLAGRKLSCGCRRQAGLETADLARVAERYIPEPNTGCWLWTGGIDRKGYGMSSRKLYGEASAHRLLWSIHRGPIPDGLNVLHRCDTPPCVNPDHLFLGTHKDNATDRDRKGRGVPPPRVQRKREREALAATSALRRLCGVKERESV